MTNQVHISTNIIIIDAEGLDIQARYENGEWTINDGYNTQTATSYDEMLNELEDIVDFHELNVNLRALENPKVDSENV